MRLQTENTKPTNRQFFADEADLIPKVGFIIEQDRLMAISRIEY